MLKSKNSIPPNIERAFQHYTEYCALRKTAEAFGLSYRTLARRFKQYYGDNYTQCKNEHGVVSIVKEYIGDNNLSKKQRNQIKEWYESNLNRIVDYNSINRETKLYTNREIQNLTYKETWHGDKDLLDVLNTLKLNN